MHVYREETILCYVRYVIHNKYEIVLDRKVTLLPFCCHKLDINLAEINHDDSLLCWKNRCVYQVYEVYGVPREPFAFWERNELQLNPKTRVNESIV